MSKLWGREPALFLAVVAASLNLAVQFGVELTDAQQAGITTAVIALLGFVTRSKVTPSD